MSNKSKTKQNIILLLMVVVIVLIPVMFIKGEYGGSDGEAEAAITELDKNYEPWFEPIFEPASGEIESLLFTLQGSIGVGIITGILGYYAGRNKCMKEVTNGQVHVLEGQ